MSGVLSHRVLVVLLIGVLAAAGDACAQTTWYVDDDAAGDPGGGDPTVSDPNEDGSAAHPFDAIQEGINAAASGDTVLVLDGEYTGMGNRDLNFGGRLITVRSTNGCADVSNQFVYAIDPDDPNGCTLEARETDPNDPNNHDVLPDLTWYQVNSAPGWTDVAAFQFEVYTLVGDCNNSGRVTTADYSEVKAHMGERTDARYDLNGSARITTADYSVVKANMGHRAPAKPVLCP